jgi:hypothetical protein
MKARKKGMRVIEGKCGGIQKFVHNIPEKIFYSAPPFVPLP